MNTKKLFFFFFTLIFWGSFTSYFETYANVYCISWMQSLCLSIHLCFQKSNCQVSGMTECYLSNLCSFIHFLRQLLSLYHYCRFLLHCLLMMRYLNHQETLQPLLSHLVNFRIRTFFFPLINCTAFIILFCVYRLQFLT